MCKKIKNLLAKILEPVFLWIKFFKVSSWWNNIVCFGLPMLIVIIMIVIKKEDETQFVERINELLNVYLNIFSILIGFIASILVMVLTTDNKIIEKSKVMMLHKNTKISLHNTIVYKFVFVFINLIILVLYVLFLKILQSFEYYHLLIITYILFNSFLVLLDSLTNTVQIYLKEIKK